MNISIKKNAKAYSALEKKELTIVNSTTKKIQKNIPLERKKY